MNNLSFGDSRHQYYETICGVAAPGPPAWMEWGFAGPPLGRAEP